MRQTMFALCVLAALLGAAGAHAQPLPPACRSFTRANADAPPAVQAWLAHSGDERVIVCRPSGAQSTSDPLPAYTGEGPVSHQGALCSYTSHGLLQVGGGTAVHLTRYERGEAVEMALAATSCPAPHAAASAPRYTETYDLTAAVFAALLELWTRAATSTSAFDRALCCERTAAAAGAAAPAAAPPPAATALAAPAPAPTAPASGPRERLRAAIDAGRMQGVPILRIVRLSGTLLRRRYAVFIADPDGHPPGPTRYVIYASKSLGGPYRITGIADAAG